jgi:hypothetical protein
MRKSLPLLLAASLVLLAEPALALRCKGKLVKEGDPQAKVLKFCGEPVSAQQRIIYRSGVPHPWVGRRLAVESDGTAVSSTEEELLIHNRSVVEVLIEEWTYNFGPHRLMRVVRFENGLVADVTGLGYGYLD